MFEETLMSIVFVHLLVLTNGSISIYKLSKFILKIIFQTEGSSLRYLPPIFPDMASIYRVLIKDS